MESQPRTAKSCLELLGEYRKNKRPGGVERILFDGVDGRDVYNITAPFEDDGQTVIAGRVEARNSELSQVLFFSRRGEIWSPLPGIRSLDLQDPFFTRIQGSLIFGGTHVFADAKGRITSWRTDFYRGNSIAELQYFAHGPVGMKDIRLVGLADGRIGVFSRPLNLPDAQAKIGFTVIDSLEELTEEVIAQAELFDNQFLPAEWGGVNEPRLLSNGHIGILGHIAYRDAANNRHYYAMAFSLDPQSRELSAIRLIAERSDFPEGPCKYPDIADCVFSGGIVREKDGNAILYAGLGDVQAQRIRIPDPFLKMEADNGR